MYVGAMYYMTLDNNEEEIHHFQMNESHSLYLSSLMIYKYY